MTTTVRTRLELRGKETLSASSVPAASEATSRELNADAFGTTQSLSADSTPSVTAGPAVYDMTMSGSTETIDLTAVQLQGGRTANMTDKRVVCASFQAAAANGGDVIVRAASSNGYDLFGATTTGLTLKPGMEVFLTFKGAVSTLALVGSSAKNLEIGGAAGRKLKIQLYFGDDA